MSPGFERFRIYIAILSHKARTVAHGCDCFGNGFMLNEVIHHLMIAKIEILAIAR